MCAAGPTTRWSYQADVHRCKKKLDCWYFHGLFSFFCHFIISKPGLIPLPFCSMSQTSAVIFYFAMKEDFWCVLTLEFAGQQRQVNAINIKISLASWWTLPPVTFRKGTLHCSLYEWSCNVFFHCKAY